MFNGGGRSLEDMQVIRADTGLREVLPLQDECDRLEHSVPESQPIPSVDIGYKFDPA